MAIYKLAPSIYGIRCMISWQFCGKFLKKTDIYQNLTLVVKYISQLDMKMFALKKSMQGKTRKIYPKEEHKK